MDAPEDDETLFSFLKLCGDLTAVLKGLPRSIKELRMSPRME
jgi:hypothetical protein